MSHEFRYEAIDAGGASVEGRIQAQDDQDAMTQLRSQSLTPVALTRTAAVAPGGARGRITDTDKILLMRELATLLRAGIPLADAVRSLADARPGTSAGDAMQRGWRTLNEGRPFVEALAAMRIEFPTYVSQLAATGEMTGKLGQSLTDAMKQMEYDERVRQELRNSLTYPVILVVAGLVAVLFVFLFVVPRFATMVKGSHGVEIPLISLWVINVGLFLKANLLLVALVIAAAVAALAASLRTAQGRVAWLTRLSRLPLLGDWLIEAETGRWATTFGTLLTNRVPILAAIELSTQGLRFAKMRHSMQLVLRDVRGGDTLADAVARYGVVTATGVNLIRVGEKSGELPQMVATLGELHSEMGRNRMKRFLLLLEPAAILIIGGMIGFIMVAIMLAITSISTSRLV